MAKLVVGLGNPGEKYANTRHNIGFSVIDTLSRKWDITCTKQKWKGLIGEEKVKGEKVFLLKPMTYMNLSGESVRSAVDWLKLDLSDVLVIYDDLDLPLGRIRLRLKGSAGGHNGLASIIQHMGSIEILRMKLGIDRPPKTISISQYVLGSFSKIEQPVIEETINTAAEAVEEWIGSSFSDVMNKYNQYLPR